jgi:hypothetical protein
MRGGTNQLYLYLAITMLTHQVEIMEYSQKHSHKQLVCRTEKIYIQNNQQSISLEA